MLLMSSLSTHSTSISLGTSVKVIGPRPAMNTGNKRGDKDPPLFDIRV